jgi:hypothetical protein
MMDIQSAERTLIPGLAGNTDPVAVQLVCANFGSITAAASRPHEALTPPIAALQVYLNIHRRTRSHFWSQRSAAIPDNNPSIAADLFAVVRSAATERRLSRAVISRIMFID